MNDFQDLKEDEEASEETLGLFATWGDVLESEFSSIKLVRLRCLTRDLGARASASRSRNAREGSLCGKTGSLET